MKLALQTVGALVMALGLTGGTFSGARGVAHAAPQAGAAAGPAAGQAKVADELLKDWQAQKKTMMDIADAMPEDKFSYKSTPAQRNYGEQVLHVAQVNVGLLKAIGGKAAAPTFTAQSAKTKAEILKALGDSYDYGTALIKEQTEATMIETVKAPAFLGPSTRARIFWTLLAHSMDIYGQMAVYLRLNGVVPPLSRTSL
jgi:uncharacterized damage-inducible protein DinB